MTGGTDYHQISSTKNEWFECKRKQWFQTSDYNDDEWWLVEIWSELSILSHYVTNRHDSHAKDSKQNGIYRGI